MGNATTFSATVEFSLQAAPWELWQPLGLTGISMKNPNFVSMYKDLRSAYGKCYHFFSHCCVLAPSCSLGALAAPGALAFQRKIQILVLCKGTCVLPMGNATTFPATVGFWLQAAPWEPWQPLRLLGISEKKPNFHMSHSLPPSPHPTQTKMSARNILCVDPPRTPPTQRCWVRQPTSG